MIVTFHKLHVGGSVDLVDELLLLQEVRELIFVAEEERDRHFLDLADLDLVCLVAF